MSKQILLLISALFLALSLQSQGDAPILLTKSYKKVKYAPEPGAKFSKVEATKSLAPEGVLKLSRKSKARLYCNGTFKELEGKGTHTVGSLFGDELQYSAMGYANLLNDRLTAAIGGSRRSDTTRTSSGWGNKKFGIASLTPIGKVDVNQIITFQWQSKKELPEYEFVIKDESGAVVHEATVTQKHYLVSLKEVGLKSGETYMWSLAEPGADGLSSNKYSFSVAGEEELAKTMKALRDEELYKQADPLMKKLMEAVWLEDAEFYYAADAAYKEADLKAEDRELTEKMRRAFLLRSVE